MISRGYWDRKLYKKLFSNAKRDLVCLHNLDRSMVFCFVEIITTYKNILHFSCACMTMKGKDRPFSPEQVAICSLLYCCGYDDRLWCVHIKRDDKQVMTNFQQRCQLLYAWNYPHTCEIRNDITFCYADSFVCILLVWYCRLAITAVRSTPSLWALDKRNYALLLF